MAIDENIKNKINNYIKYSIDSLEIAIGMVECSNDLSEVCDDEAEDMCKKISSAIHILRDI